MKRRVLAALLCFSCFLSGACLSEGVDLTGYRVCIDPGHQARLDDRQEPVAPWSMETKDRAAGCAQGVKTRRRESAVNLEIALRLRDALEAMGAEVLLVREVEDIRVSNVQRAQIANQFQADVFLRLHCNANDNPKQRGIRVYAPRRAAALYYGVEREQMLAWAKSCAELIQAETGSPSASGATNDTYSGSNWAQMPTFLIEMGYMTNAEDDVLLSDTTYQDGVIQGIARFIQTLPKDAYRDHPVMTAPVMENHKSETERITVYAEPDTASAILTTVGRGYRVFVLDDLGSGWRQVKTYQGSVIGYTDCETLVPCR